MANVLSKSQSCKLARLLRLFGSTQISTCMASDKIQCVHSWEGACTQAGGLWDSAVLPLVMRSSALQYHAVLTRMNTTVQEGSLAEPWVQSTWNEILTAACAAEAWPGAQSSWNSTFLPIKWWQGLSTCISMGVARLQGPRYIAQWEARSAIRSQTAQLLVKTVSHKIIFRIGFHEYN